MKLNYLIVFILSYQYITMSYKFHVLKSIHKLAQTKINRLDFRYNSKLSSTKQDLPIVTSIINKGEEIRKLKSEKADKQVIDDLVKQLLQLKEEYKTITGESYDPIKDNKKPIKKNDIIIDNIKDNNNKEESKVITSRLTDYSEWYNDVISAADMVDSSPVRGCMVIKPWGMGIWDLLRSDVDNRIRETGTQNAYFPLFIPKSFLAKEAEHVEGFAKECAVVTHHRLCVSPDGKDLIPDPEAELEEPLIVRPTSETLIWNMFGKWISSYRDLPLKINQWANVVRWEMRTRPFLRSSEFLWQEGHTAHATSDDAVETATQILDMYSSVCEEILAMPVVKGRKSPSERFAGADDTYTIEALMQNGWALQSGTSHFLGQNFAKAFDVYYQTVSGTRELVWATSWGVSTRLIGALVMTHSDDKGLVLPPKVAPIQVVIVPITKGSNEESTKVTEKANDIMKHLKSRGIRVKVDDRENLRPGAKYFEWERKGLPIRIDIGSRDITSQTAVLAYRHSGLKETISIESYDELTNHIFQSFTNIHNDLYNKAKDRLTNKTFRLNTYNEMKDLIEKGNNGDLSSAGFYLVPWKCNANNEALIKEECKATIRCYPIDLNTEEYYNKYTKNLKCFYSNEPASHLAIFARAF